MSMFGGGGGNVKHRIFSLMNLPRHVGEVWVPWEFKVRKLGCVSRPARFVGSSDVIRRSIPLTPLTPYNPARRSFRYE
jgi:hypothetical protein